ncbi:hypothetical protein CEUSTIGMA_g7475.t1 [Chlamydomonas eustigma]|uniref:Inositol-1-monophosphatase n=1 Tax=Chlamydomonas eustigma TaxID=1157962 RepID=A0A250XAH0_9CHLO|nr:hypothetical protein CEUSTIGMA_g7475.t1 [Chlamydomonas eustigma]|eukprot:GAX80036.1 hypothetical protein CEUSTIGMA_g7475.t1 [Chlamydomonas eustigma]
MKNSEVNDKYLSVALAAANAAGNVIKDAFSSRSKHVEHKGTVDLVTETDKKCESLVLSLIQETFPSHKFIGEEGSAAQGFTAELTDDPTWMCDPLDGTTNFVHGFPFVCVSIALVIGREVIVGVVHNPILNETYTAIKGQGAKLNDAPISVSATCDLGTALIATEVGTSRDQETLSTIFSRMKTLTSAARAVRCCGSCAMNLCGVASGRLDAFYEIGFGGCWDVAAGKLIVEEAGGMVLDPQGGPFDVMGRRVLAGNPAVAQAAANILAGCPVSALEPQASGHQ